MKIGVQFDADTMTYDLVIEDGMMRAMPAGPRLFRGGEPSAIQFSHETHEAALRDAAKLQAYLTAPKKGPSKRALRETHL